jgi:hypothetical protein
MAMRQAQGLVVLSPSLPKTPWAKWAKSLGRQNGFDLKAKCPPQAEDCLRRTFSFDIFAILTPRMWI